MPTGPRTPPPESPVLESQIVSKTTPRPFLETYAEAFPAELGPKQIKYKPGESSKIFADTKRRYLVELDIGSLLRVWEWAEGRAQKEFLHRNNMPNSAAIVRAAQAFRDAYTKGTI